KWERFQAGLSEVIGRFPFANYIEASRTDLPHMNVVLPSAVLATLLGAFPAEGYRAREGLSPEWLNTIACKAGFGFRSTAKVFGTKRDAVSYCTKQAKAVRGVTGEVTKLSQYPVRAPRKFRRVRS